MKTVGEFAAWQERTRVDPSEGAWVEVIRQRILRDLMRGVRETHRPATWRETFADGPRSIRERSEP